MARPWRIQYEGAVYHVTSRGNNKEDIFLDADDRGYFLRLLARGRQRFNLQIFAFCLMGNHFHLFLRTADANLSKAMQWLNGSYSGYFNWRHQRVGHLLQGRYKAVLVVEETHYLHLSMYLHLNPVRAGIVEDPDEYQWSSCLDYTRPAPRFGWLMRDEILSHYGQSKTSRARRYRLECLALLNREPAFVEQLKTAAILGPGELVEEIRKRYRPSGKTDAVPEYVAASRKQRELEAELQKVANAFGIKRDDLMRKRRNFPARLAAYYHLVENCGFPVTTVAQKLGAGTPAISMGIKSVMELSAKNQRLKRIIQSLTDN